MAAKACRLRGAAIFPTPTLRTHLPTPGSRTNANNSSPLVDVSFHKANSKVHTRITSCGNCLSCSRPNAVSMNNHCCRQHLRSLVRDASEVYITVHNSHVLDNEGHNAYCCNVAPPRPAPPTSCDLCRSHFVMSATYLVYHDFACQPPPCRQARARNRTQSRQTDKDQREDNVNVRSFVRSFVRLFVARLHPTNPPTHPLTHSLTHSHFIHFYSGLWNTFSTTLVPRVPLNT